MFKIIGEQFQKLFFYINTQVQKIVTTTTICYKSVKINFPANFDDQQKFENNKIKKKQLRT